MRIMRKVNISKLFATSTLVGIICSVYVLILIGRGWTVHSSTTIKYVLIENESSADRSSIADRYEFVQNMSQDDPLLWKYIRTHYLTPPSGKPYNFTSADSGLGSSSCDEQCAIVMKYLKNMKNGFYIEVGAYDGETDPNTLALERQFRWNGILIEGDPITFAKLKSKHRNAWISDTCLSPSDKPYLATFNHAEGREGTSNANAAVTGHIKGTVDLSANSVLGPVKGGYIKRKVKEWITFQVQCFPIYAILSAINVTTVDYFSLDVEGVELGVLQAIPFDKLFVKVFSVEYHMLTKEAQTSLLKLMKSKNYVMVEKVANDFMFVHQSLIDEQS